MNKWHIVLSPCILPHENPSGGVLPTMGTPGAQGKKVQNIYYTPSHKTLISINLDSSYCTHCTHTLGSPVLITHSSIPHTCTYNPQLCDGRSFSYTQSLLQECQVCQVSTWPTTYMYTFSHPTHIICESGHTSFAILPSWTLLHGVAYVLHIRHSRCTR